MSNVAIVKRAGGILIKNRKTLVERSKGRKFFIQPGGIIEKGETPQQALIRELLEEFRIVVKETDLVEFGIFTKNAGGQERYDVHMVIFLVKSWQGDPSPDNEVEEFRWINSTVPDDIEIGSMLKNEVLPEMVAQGLID